MGADGEIRQLRRLGDPSIRPAEGQQPQELALTSRQGPHAQLDAGSRSAGADGCLAKDQSSRQVATAIRDLAAGEQAVVAAEATLGLHPSVDLLVRTLTPREREFLALLATGCSNRRIAEATQLSYLTIRSHMQNLLLKLGVHSQLEAVAFAVEHGIVAVDGASPAWEARSA